MFIKILKISSDLSPLSEADVVRTEGSTYFTSGECAPLFCVFYSLISVVRQMTFVLDQNMKNIFFYLLPI